MITYASCINNESFSDLNKDESSIPKIEKLSLKSAFQAEHLYSPSDNNQGSWVSMTFDNKGRLIASDQYGSLYRLEIPPIGKGSNELIVEKLNVNMGYAQGLLWAFNSLYVVVNHQGSEDFAKTSGLYRLQDTNQDDQYDKVTLLKSFEGAGEHGPHSIVLAPDKKNLYLIAGNRTDLPEMNAYRLPPVGQQDNLFPLINYPSGGGEVNRKAPAGWIAKVDSTGSYWELISAGLRNAYDMAFNEAGDLFTYESDKEFDLGMPWYKPTRVYHVTSGSEFGWRTGSDIWPSTYPDMIPEIVNVGPGSPTALISGNNARFPDKYRRALFGFDWSFGIIYAIHLQNEGSSYTANIEEFISGTPLPLTHGVIGPDGAMYFLTGGRRLESNLYRVYYEDFANINPSSSYTTNLEETDEQKIRDKLESYHEKSDINAIETAWPYLNHNDHFIRYAARIVLEHQPVTLWQERALNEQNPQALTHAIIALVRHGDQNLKPRMLASLLNINFELLVEQEQLDLLRAFELILLRMGKPDPEQHSQLINYLNPHYPANSNKLNKLFSKILIFLEAPQVVEKTLSLLNMSGETSDHETIINSTDLIYRNPQYGLAIAEMLENVPPSRQVYFAIALSEAKNGWNSMLREEYFKWFNFAFNFKGGRNYIGYINEARKNALVNVPKDQYEYYETISGSDKVDNVGVSLSEIPQPMGPGRNWNVDDAMDLVQNELFNRDFNQGEKMFAAALCSSCHGMRGEGGSIGPDLTQLGTRFTVRDILEKIIEPNNVISDQFASTVFYFNDGSSMVGRIMNENENHFIISQNPYSPQSLIEISKNDISRTAVSEVSIMPSGLINRLNEEEVKDLIAFLISGGNIDHHVFNKESE